MRLRLVKDYSQDKEQQIIINHFGGNTGMLLDIGASDGERFSNSRALMESGWWGTLVEPCARSFAKLVDLYLDNPRARLINAAISKSTGGEMCEMQYAMDSVVSTFDKATYNAWEASGRYRTVEMRTVSVIELFPQGTASGFDFITIDAEGWSFGIADMMLSRAKPSLWCIESDPGFELFEKLMNVHGYEHFHSTQSNSLWRRK